MSDVPFKEVISPSQELSWVYGVSNPLRRLRNTLNSQNIIPLRVTTLFLSPRIFGSVYQTEPKTQVWKLTWRSSQPPSLQMWKLRSRLKSFQSSTRKQLEAFRQNLSSHLSQSYLQDLNLFISHSE